MAYFNAIYASQVRKTDDHVKSVLTSSNRWIDIQIPSSSLALITVRLWGLTTITYHGCSAFNSVAGVHWSFKAPNVSAQDYPGWISTTDVAPTLMSLAGIEWSGPLEGRDLAAGLLDGNLTYEPVFVERGTETAGVIFQQNKYILSTQDEFAQCTPYNQVPYGFASPREQVFDLNSDPNEQSNLYQQAPNLKTQGQSILCNWITSSTWTTANNDPTHPMVQRCVTLLEQLEPPNKL